MSKYIDTENLHKVVLKRKTEYGSLADLIDNIVEEMVKETPYADVVERSEYVESQKEVMRLRDLSHKVNQDAMYYEEMYRELHRKINKAILALEREQNSEFWTSTFRDGIDYALKLIKKNVDIEEDNK